MPAISAKNDTSDSEESTGPVTAATERLLSTVGALDDAALAAPSLCPGWTRAHVIAHLARNADALTNLLTWARTGQEEWMYASRAEREAGIAAGPGRGAADLLDDLRSASERFASAVTDLPADAWQREVRTGPSGAGKAIPARRTLWIRLQELEVHHLDLDAGYRSADWTDLFVRRALSETIRGFGQRDDVPPFTMVIGGAAARLGTGGKATVAGPDHAVLAWLMGRSTGSDLRVGPDAPLPQLPGWL